MLTRLTILNCFFCVLLVAGCNNDKLTAECNDGEGKSAGGIVHKQKNRSKPKSAEIITIPLTDYSITDTTLNFTGTTLVYWFPPNVMSEHCSVIVKSFGWQYFHEGVDVVACFEVTREPLLEERAIRFIRLNKAYSSVTVKNGRYTKHLVLERLMYKPGLIVLGKNNNPVFYPLMKHGCENKLLETGYLKLLPE